MGMVAKMTGGKRVDFSMSGSYQRRCDAAAMALDQGPSWVLSPMRRLSGRTPEQTVKRLCLKRERRRSARRLSYAAAKEKPGATRFKKKRRAGPDGYYGNAKEDLPLEERLKVEAALLAEMEDAFGTAEKRAAIERETRGQFENDLFRYWHCKLLTSTQFKDVCRRRPDTPCHNQVKNCLYPTPIDHLPQIIFGKKYEKRAVELFEMKYGKKCRECGLCVCEEKPHDLATAPDRVIVETVLEGGEEIEVDGDEIVETKCLPSIQGPIRDANVPWLELVDPDQGPRKRRQKGAEEREAEQVTKILRLRRSSQYYYQVQGQLSITGKSRCYFVIYWNYPDPTDPKKCIEGIWEEVIPRDDNFWPTNAPPLHLFYGEAVLPERADPRHPERKMTIRDPPYILQAIQKRKEAKEANEKKKKGAENRPT